MKTETEYNIECICDVWLDADGKVWRTSSENKELHMPVEGYEPKCEFHSQYPDVFYDRDAWYDIYAGQV